jgi:hypothetical protein
VRLIRPAFSDGGLTKKLSDCHAAVGDSKEDCCGAAVALGEGKTLC